MKSSAQYIYYHHDSKFLLLMMLMIMNKIHIICLLTYELWSDTWYFVKSLKKRYSKMFNAFIFDENFNSNTYTKLYVIDFEK